MKKLFLLLALVFVRGAGAQTAPGETRVFVPVLVSHLPGAGGSVWQTDLWVANRTDLPIVYSVAPCNQACCCAEINTIRPQSTSVRGDDRPTGRWVASLSDGSILIEARFRDLSRNASSAGIELPIVRESDFRSDEVNLVSVPRDPRFRVTLRIYGLETAAPVIVEQLDAAGQLLRTDQVLLAPPVNALYPLLTSYAQLQVDATPADSSPLRLRIRPTVPSLHIWALASVTNNETSEVVLIQPPRQ
jgi:hypothetical protein